MVSVIIPNYNHALYLQKRIDSVLEQTYRDFEVILLDDCSTDKSRELIEQYRSDPKVACIVYNEINSGGTFQQWVKGIKLAKGEYIWIAESDDFAAPTFLETAVKSFQSNNCSVFYSQSYIINEFGTIQGIWNENSLIYNIDFEMDGNVLIQKYMTFENIIPNASAVVFRKELLNSELKKNLMSFKINGDWFLWINLILKGTCTFSCQPLNYFRRHKDAGSPKNVINFKNIEEAFRINLFLKKEGFKINGKNWLKLWVAQAQFSLNTLIRRNFINIYKVSFGLYIFPFSYVIYIILSHKTAILKRKLKCLTYE